MRFQSILVDIDATAAAHPALDAAFELSARCNARVKLVDVIPDLPRGARKVITEQQEQQLADARLALLTALAGSRPDLPIDAEVLRGKPAIAIIRQVLRAHHEVVVRSHGRDLVPGGQFGAVDMQLLRKCPCPVWLIGPERGAHPPHILAAIDTESNEPVADALNRTILDLALTLGEARHAKVTALQAWSLYGEELLRSRMRDEELQDALETSRRTATEGLASLIERFGSRAAGVDVECVKGDPREVIPQFARAHHVGTVVMGTVARTGIAGFLMGNTAEMVLRELRGSVLAAKPPGFASPVTLAESAERPVVIV
jgi:universal stress protein E